MKRTVKLGSVAALSLVMAACGNNANSNSTTNSSATSVMESGATNATTESSGVSCEKTSEEDIAALFDRWNDDLKSGDPANVAENYATDSVLLPTVSNKVRFSADEKKDYFAHWLEKKPSGVVNKRWIELDCNHAVDTGVYTFTYGDGSKVPARYTFVYGVEGGEWKILTHHSSAMPVAGADTDMPPADMSTGSPPPATDVDGCATVHAGDMDKKIGAWSDALSSGDAAAVVKHYAQDSVLIAPDSNEMLMTAAEKEQYFKQLMEKQPTLTMDDHWTSFECNAATDSGLYTMTFADGTTTKGRFTSTYRWNGAEWEITSQHASVMPE
ncbi:SgcJ/EcaC family oxidoreductase [Corynebacterium sp.]|uniref:SgcJ/EcaC family oxidoreductase n=1 Tax=Corynebacterium sp. TaxID=1720 RepID=UPI0026DC4A4B|nr:SgcJ/EcaC family oxidoreductase [Corynebacterium sp.]MDO5077319.1 SgcJ/EcaC family oxidoreductase [Corynebacterium sp.]